MVEVNFLINFQIGLIDANPVIFVIFWVPVCRVEVDVVLRPLPNHQNKQLENTDQVFV